MSSAQFVTSAQFVSSAQFVTQCIHFGKCLAGARPILVRQCKQLHRENQHILSCWELEGIWSCDSTTTQACLFQSFGQSEQTFGTTADRQHSLCASDGAEMIMNYDCEEKNTESGVDSRYKNFKRKDNAYSEQLSFCLATKV